MALGGGNFLVQNKVLPGSYINFVTTASASTVFAERGTGAIAMAMNWGPEGKLIELTQDKFEKNSKSIFGCDYTDESLMPIRDFFKNGKTLLLYNLCGNSEDGVKAENEHATALYAGEVGNKISTKNLDSADTNDLYEYYTYFDGELVDKQVVTDWDELKDNDYVQWKRDGDISNLINQPLKGGKNGTAKGSEAANFLSCLESKSFNTVAIDTTDEVVIASLVSFTKRMRDERGLKFQAVVYSDKKFDYEGVINVKNKFGLTDDYTDTENANKGIYWTAGAQAGCAVNKSLTNKAYDGEYNVDTAYTQDELEDIVNSGYFAFHNVGDEVRVLLDYNTLVTFTNDKNENFRDNQTVRVCDQIAGDIATIFNNSYLGLVPNDRAGRTSLWSDIVKHHKNLMSTRAIDDFDEEDVTVEQGETKNSVVVYDAVVPVNAMAKLYMTVTVN